MNRASVFEWHKRFKEGRESARDDERCGRSKEVNTPELIGQRSRVRVTKKESLETYLMILVYQIVNRFKKEAITLFSHETSNVK